MLKHTSPAKLMMIAAAMVSTPVFGQDPLPTTPFASKPDSVSNNDATNEWDTRVENTVIPLRHIQANWVVLNIRELFFKQKEEFSIIGDDRQVVVRGNKRIIEEIMNVVESIDRPPPSIEEPRNEPKLSALPAAIAEEVVAELKDVESPEGRERLKAALRKEFERNQNQLRESLMELAKRVKESQELLARRDQLADQIIDLRFKELTAATPSGPKINATEVVGSRLRLGPANVPSAVPSSDGQEQPSEFQSRLRKPRKEPSIDEATSAQPMRTPDEYVKLLQEYRSGAKRYTARHSSRQAIIDQLSKSEVLNDQDKRNLKLEEEGLVSDNAFAGRSLNNWKRIWSEYQTQLKLLRLDVQEAETILSSVVKNAESLKALAGHTIPTPVYEEQLTLVELAKIKVTRATNIYELYAEIETSEPELNPSTMEQSPSVDGTR